MTSASEVLLIVLEKWISGIHDEISKLLRARTRCPTEPISIISIITKGNSNNKKKASGGKKTQQQKKEASNNKQNKGSRSKRKERHQKQKPKRGGSSKKGKRQQLQKKGLNNEVVKSLPGTTTRLREQSARSARWRRP